MPKTCSVPCCFTSTETIRLIKDGEPRTATSTFTQLLSSDKKNKFQADFKPISLYNRGAVAMSQSL